MGGPRHPSGAGGGGLEWTFIEWADQDTQAEAFCKINEYKHVFLQQRYLKADGMPAMYSPDFLLMTQDNVYVVETKAEKDLSNENVQRKRRAARAWCDRINSLSPELRENRTWVYVLLGQEAVESWRARHARITDLLDYAKVTSQRDIVVQERFL